MNQLKRYWMGKSPKVRAAVEEYIAQMKKYEIREYPFNFNKYESQFNNWISQEDLSQKYGVSKQAISQRVRDILTYKKHRVLYFKEGEYFDPYDRKNGGIKDA